MVPAISPSLLKRLLKDSMFDPELAKNLEFDDFVEQAPLLPPIVICMSHDQDEEATDQLFLV